MKSETAKHPKLGPWKGICSFACWYALEERCRCKCGGVNHGRGISLKYRKLDDFTETEAALARENEESRALARGAVLIINGFSRGE